MRAAYGDNRLAPDCATGRYVHVGSYVQASECMYLRDKWLPQGEFFHITMDAAAGELKPSVTSGQSVAVWWSKAVGSWDFSDPDRVTAEMFFEWKGCWIVGVGVGTCNRTVLGTFSADGTELHWSESIKAIRTHVPWYRCELVPHKCVGTVRWPWLPQMSTMTIYRRLMFGRLHGHVILAVNRTYELDQSNFLYMSSYIFGIGELREGEWISFRSSQWGAVNDPHDEVYIPSSQQMRADGRTYVVNRQPRRAPGPGEQPGVLSTSPRPGVEWTEAFAPPEGYTFDPVTQTSTYTLVGPPSCDQPGFNQPCIQKQGHYAARTEAPSPPPAPPTPPIWPPGFFTPSPAPPTPAAPPDGLWLWSNPSTWGGVLPKRGDTVEIPEGITIIMDVSPPFLWRLDVKGTLMVYSRSPVDGDETDVTLHLVYLHIHTGGTMAAGSPGDPFRGRFAIHLVGDKFAEPRDFCGVGSKAICIEGRLFLNGQKPDRAWTRLNSTATIGSDTLVLTEQVSWRAGETAILAATGYDQAHAERVTIGDARHRTGTGYGSPTVLTSTVPLAHTHYASTERHGAFDVEMRAEVALLSRNIEIVSVDMFDADYFFRPQTNMYGWRMKILDGGEANLQGVRFVKGGYWGKSPKKYHPQSHAQCSVRSVHQPMHCACPQVPSGRHARVVRLGDSQLCV